MAHAQRSSKESAFPSLTSFIWEPATTQLSHTTDKQPQITAHGDLTRDFIAQTYFFLKTSSFTITDLGLEPSCPKFCSELWPSDNFFCLIWHPAYTDPRKELRSLEAALALGPPGWAPLSMGQSSGHTWRPVPAHSHLSARGCRWEPQSGCVWKTASRNPGEPHFHKGTHRRHSACKGKGNTRNNVRQVISQMLIHCDQSGTD